MMELAKLLADDHEYAPGSPFYAHKKQETVYNPNKDRTLKGKQRRKARKIENAQIKKYVLTDPWGHQ